MPVGGEQADNAARVVFLGAGLRADVRRATASEIAAKVRRLIEEPAFRRRAREIAAAVTRTQGAVTAARFIERLAETRRPLRRPEGSALTVTRDTPPP
jgi:UDP:flavonoid glycosyltransferase YjiC (YdhE family)